MNSVSSQSKTRENSIDSAIAEYLIAKGTHTPFDRAAWLANHRDIEEELREFLIDEDRVAQMLSPVVDNAKETGTQWIDPRTTESPVGERGSASIVLPSSIDDYEILEEIARGGMGVVFRARQKSLNRLVALKMVLGHRLASSKDVERFQREAEAAAGLDHPNIVPIYEVGAIEGLPYFSMKLIEGGSLAQSITRSEKSQSNQSTPLAGRAASPPGDFRRMVILMATVARAVHHAHQRGILHRDLKPSNVLLDERGEPHVVDFGLAKRIENDQTISQSGAIVGTPSYMAPEQARGQHEKLTTAVDVYGLGTILYELLTARPPFRGATTADTLVQVLTEDPVRPSQIRKDVPRDLETICLKCLQKDPAQRYGSAEALAEDLERWQRYVPIKARPATFRERTTKWMRRNPVIAGLTGLSALLLMVIAIGGVALSVRLFNALGQSRTDRASAVKDRDIARSSEREARKRELGALISEAKSQRFSRRIGQRFDTLDTIRKAAVLARELEEPTATFDELRNLAISALALPDLQSTSLWCVGPSEPGWKLNEWMVTRSANLYAESSRNMGAVSIRRLTDDPANSIELARLPGHGADSRPFWCEDARHLIVWHLTRPAARVVLWRMDDETPQSVIDEHDGCNQAGLTPDGRSFLTVNVAGQVRIYDAVTRSVRCTANIPGETTTMFRMIAFHPRLPRAFLVSRGLIFVLDWETGKEVSRFPVFNGEISSIAMHPRDEILYVAYTYAEGFEAYDLQQQKVIFETEHRGGGVQLSVNAIGDVLVSCGWAGVAKFWSPFTGREIFSTPAVGHPQFLDNDCL